MLTLLLAFALHAPTAAPTRLLPLTMSDTTPPGIPVGVPFTRAEYVRAQMQVRTQEEAETLAARLFDAPEAIGAHVMDGDLLLLALVSENLAARVIAWRPSLRQRVNEFRRERQKTLESWRAAVRDSPLP